jgi:hypothetical protein
MDFGKAFTYMFEDPDWLRKLGIGTAITLVGVLLTPFLIGIIPLLMVTGYTVDVVRNVMIRKERPLPEWEDWGGFLGRGFKIFIALLVWALPIIVLMIPIVISAMLLDQNGRGMEAIGVPIMICGYCLVILWSLFLALITPAIYVRVAATDRIGAAFELGRVWAFTRDNLGHIIVAVLLGIVAGMIAGIGAMLGLVALIIGVLVTIPLASLWQMLVNAHLYGQIGAASVTPVD